MEYHGNALPPPPRPADRVMLPPTDWEELSRENLESRITQFCELCEGKGHPTLSGRGPCFRPSEDVPYIQNALGIVKWVIDMSGQGAEDAFLYYSEAAEVVVVDRFFYFWEMYKCYHRYQMQLAGELGVGSPEVEKDVCTLQRFSFCYEVCDRIHTVQKAICDLYRMMLNKSDFVVPECVVRSETHKSLLRRHSCGDEGQKKTDYEELLLHLLNCAGANRYRKLGDVVYEEKTVEYAGRRYNTRAWEPANFDSTRPETVASTIGAFISRFCRKETHYDMWSRLVNIRDCSRRLESYLIHSEDIEFPFLRPCRHIFSFNNGIYDTSSDVIGAFYPYSSASEHLPPNIVAAKYFDMTVDPSWVVTASRGHWWDVPTPRFQSILDYQNWGVVTTSSSALEQESMEEDAAPPIMQMLVAETTRIWETLDNQFKVSIDKLKHGTEADASILMKEILESAETCKKASKDLMDRAERASQGLDADPNTGRPAAAPTRRAAGAAFPIEAQKWVYVFLGRLLHALGTYDTWQIIPFFKGRGGTGKSTVAHVAKSFFSAADVGVLSNNSEKKFGLQSLIGKLMFLCFELKKNISLDQAEFQSMVSGEEVCVAIKNQVAQTIRWNLPGLLCGNEAPGWVDTQGSIARRIAIFSFNFKIADKDSNPELFKHILGQELAALIIKCNAAYRDMADRHRGEDVWGLLPEYFRKERLSCQRDTDPLYCTIWDDFSYELASRDGIDTQTCFMPFEEFDQDYKRRHRDLRGNPFAEALVQDKYGAAFEEAGIDVVVDERTYNDSKRKEKWLVGIRPIRTNYVSTL